MENVLNRTGVPIHFLAAPASYFFFQAAPAPFFLSGSSSGSFFFKAAPALQGVKNMRLRLRLQGVKNMQLLAASALKYDL